MLVVLFFFLVEFFLLVGVGVFGLCIAVPALRRFALSAALWCACWGPSTVAFLLLAGLSMLAQDAVRSSLPASSVKLPPLPPWSVYAALALLLTLALASGLAALHQWLIERMTLALFRIYCMGVLCGIGGTLWLGLSVWLGLNDAPLRVPISLILLAILPVGGGYAGFRWASQLRGTRPETLQWITPDEFDPATN